MCIVSEKITFCTCGTADVSRLNHSWALYRCVKGRELVVLGEPILPTCLKDPFYLLNNSTLAARLNEPDAFDKPMAFKPKDKLVIVFNSKRRSAGCADTLIFTFKYRKGSWQPTEEDPFDLVNQYDEVKSGKVKKALKRNRLNVDRGNAS